MKRVVTRFRRSCAAQRSVINSEHERPRENTAVFPPSEYHVMEGVFIWWAPLSVHSLDLMTCPVSTIWQDCQGEARQRSPWHKPFDPRVGARQSTANSKTRKNLLCHCSPPPVEMHHTCAEHLLGKCFFGMSCKLRLMVYGPNSKAGIKGELKSNKNFSVWVWSENNTLMS